MSPESTQRWLDSRMARGLQKLDSLITVATHEPGQLWDCVADLQATDTDVAEALSAGIVAGLAHPRFTSLTNHLLRELNDSFLPGAAQLPRTRTLLWAVALALANIERIEREAGEIP